MSEPVTNAEVEDVLASIRRLVGDKSAPSVSYSVDMGVDRLVLTPQQRVPNTGIFQLTAEHAVSVPDTWQEFEEPPLVSSDDMSQTDHARTASDDGQNALDEAVKRDENSSDVPEASSQRVADCGPKLSRYGSLTDKIAALEEAIARTQEQWEPDEAGTDAYAGTTSPKMTWPVNENLDGHGNSLDTTPTGHHEDEEPEDDAQILDEATLQALIVDVVRAEIQTGVVAEIVKGELQGELGARITRNIRKLVRREIQLALTAQGLK